MRAVYLMLAAATIRLGCIQTAGAAPIDQTAAGQAPIKKSSGTYHRPVCPKTSGAQVMRCHSLVVTDSKGNPIEHAAPPHRHSPNSKPQTH